MITESALADLILVHGGPVAEISVITRPAEASTAIVRDGHAVKADGDWPRYGRGQRVSAGAQRVIGLLRQQGVVGSMSVTNGRPLSSRQA